MNWSMPRPILQIVALALGLACLASFAMGVITAQPPARLPGEGVAAAGPAQVIQAQEAQPLVDERIEGPPQPPPLTDEERARIEAEKAAKAEAERAKAEADQAAAAGVVQPPPEKAGEPADKAQPKATPPKPAAPKAEEPPF
jgi:hypothetical protein